MKALIKICIIALTVFSIGTVNAQNTKADKKAAKELALKNKIDSGKFTFVANFAMPMRAGRQIFLNGTYYDLKVSKDTVAAWLPYFGQVQMAAPYGSEDGGIKFTSTNFEYKVTAKKKGGWQVLITFKNNPKASRMTLDISTNGTATLTSISYNRDTISFYGNITMDDKPQIAKS